MGIGKGYFGNFMNKQQKLLKTATWLRKLADRYEQLANGQVDENNTRVVIEIKWLSRLVAKALYEDWL